jgi:hypothetical protein
MAGVALKGSDQVVQAALPCVHWIFADWWTPKELWLLWRIQRGSRDAKMVGKGRDLQRHMEGRPE